MRTLVRVTFLTVVALTLVLTDAWEASSRLAPDRGDASPNMLLAAGRRRSGRRSAPVRAPAPKPEPAPPAPDPASTAEPAATPPPSSGGLSGGTTRIDFDAMHIKGQTTKAGEVQILERKDTELKSMVKRRTSFRDEIIQTVFPDKSS